MVPSFQQWLARQSMRGWNPIQPAAMWLRGFYAILWLSVISIWHWPSYRLVQEDNSCRWSICCLRHRRGNIWHARKMRSCCSVHLIGNGWTMKRNKAQLDYVGNEVSSRLFTESWRSPVLNPCRPYGDCLHLPGLFYTGRVEQKWILVDQYQGFT
jgi:hypothetical protein